jgi:hypothetical protein
MASTLLHVSTKAANRLLQPQTAGINDATYYKDTPCCKTCTMNITPQRAAAATHLQLLVLQQLKQQHCCISKCAGLCCIHNKQHCCCLLKVVVPDGLHLPTNLPAAAPAATKSRGDYPQHSNLAAD